MTRRKLLPKILKCPCGRFAKHNRIFDDCFVKCPRLNCWEGPTRKTERGAINAWNKLMSAGELSAKIYKGRWFLVPRDSLTRCGTL